MKRILLVGFLLILCACLLFSEEEQKEKKIALPIVLNLVPGLGIGSFTQGDTLGGVICLVGDLVGGGLIAFGVFGTFGYLAMETVTLTMYEGKWDMEKARNMILIGLPIFMATKVFGILRPIWYGVSYNKKLREERVSILPGLQYTSISTGYVRGIPCIQLSIRFP